MKWLLKYSIFIAVLGLTLPSQANPSGKRCEGSLVPKRIGLIGTHATARQLVISYTNGIYNKDEKWQRRLDRLDKTVSAESLARVIRYLERRLSPQATVAHLRNLSYFMSIRDPEVLKDRAQVYENYLNRRRQAGDPSGKEIIDARMMKSLSGLELGDPMDIMRILNLLEARLGRRHVVHLIKTNLSGISKSSAERLREVIAMLEIYVLDGRQVDRLLKLNLQAVGETYPSELQKRLAVLHSFMSTQEIGLVLSRNYYSFINSSPRHLDLHRVRLTDAVGGELAAKLFVDRFLLFASTDLKFDEAYRRFTEDDYANFLKVKEVLGVFLNEQSLESHIQSDPLTYLLSSPNNILTNMQIVETVVGYTDMIGMFTFQPAPFITADPKHFNPTVNFLSKLLGPETAKAVVISHIETLAATTQAEFWAALERAADRGMDMDDISKAIRNDLSQFISK